MSGWNGDGFIARVTNKRWRRNRKRKKISRRQRFRHYTELRQFSTRLHQPRSFGATGDRSFFGTRFPALRVFRFGGIGIKFSCTAGGRANSTAKSTQPTPTEYLPRETPNAHCATDIQSAAARGRPQFATDSFSSRSAPPDPERASCSRESHVVGWRKPAMWRCWRFYPGNRTVFV